MLYLDSKYFLKLKIFEITLVKNKLLQYKFERRFNQIRINILNNFFWFYNSDI